MYASIPKITFPCNMFTFHRVSMGHAVYDFLNIFGNNMFYLQLLKNGYKSNRDYYVYKITPGVFLCGQYTWLVYTGIYRKSYI